MQQTLLPLQAVVLGGLNRSQLKEYQLGKDVYKKQPMITVSEDDLPAKETLTHFFQEDLELSNQWFVQPDDECVYRAIKSRRHAIIEVVNERTIHYHSPNPPSLPGPPHMWVPSIRETESPPSLRKG